MKAKLFALAAIALWATLASLGLALQHVPPFLLTGVALLIGSVPAWPFFRQWKVPLKTLALGVYGLFGFHFLLFIALRYAPPVQANLVNYLWPLLMVVMAPVFLRGTQLNAMHLIAACAGFMGACIAIVGEKGLQGGFAWGYVPALGSAFIWASYSLMSKRLANNGHAFPTAAIGLFGVVSGLLSLLCHVALEPRTALLAQDWLLLAVMGLGPLGAAFFLWDRALKFGDARHIGILSYITPVASTVLLVLVTQRPLHWSMGLATVLIVGAAALGTRAK